MIHLIGYLGKKRNGRIFEETLAIISTCPVDKERDGGSGILPAWLSPLQFQSQPLLCQSALVTTKPKPSPQSVSCPEKKPPRFMSGWAKDQLMAYSYNSLYRVRQGVQDSSFVQRPPAPQPEG